MSPFTRNRARKVWSIAVLGAVMFSSSGLLVMFGAGSAAADQPITISSPAQDSLIRVSNPVFSGTAPYGADSVTVSTSEGVGCTAMVRPFTSWSCQVRGLTTTSAITVTATSGHHYSYFTPPPSNPQPDSVTNDYQVLLPPTIGGSLNGTFRSTNAQPTFGGTADPSATVLVTVGASQCTTTADGSGRWSCTLDNALPDGPRYDPLTDQVRVTQSPAWAPALISDPATAVYSLLPLQLPDPAFSYPVDTSNGPSTAYLLNTRPVLVGTAQPGARIVVTYGLQETSGGATYCVTVANGFGGFSCPFSGPTPMTVGHTYFIRARQVGYFTYGSAGTTDLFYLAFINPPSIPTITAPPNRSETSNTTLSGTSDPDSTVHVLLVDNPWFPRQICQTMLGDADTTWSCPTSLTPGSHTIVAYANDQHGNVSPKTAPRSFTILPPPLSPGISSPSSGYTSSQPDLTVTGTGVSGTTIDVAIGSAPTCSATVSPLGQWSCQLHSIPSGVNQILSAVAVDAYGTPSTAATETVTILGAPVAPVITSPANPYESSQTALAVAGTGATDDGDGIQVLLDGASACTAVVAAGGWTCTIGSVPAGPHTLTAIATDGYGTPSLASPAVAVQIDDPPATPVISSPEGSFTTFATTVTVSGTSPGDSGGAGGHGLSVASIITMGAPASATTIHVVVDGAPACTASVPVSGTWQCTTPALGLGSHTLYAYSVDPYGTSSAHSTPVHFRVVAPPADVVPPPSTPAADSQPSGNPGPPSDSRLAITGNSHHHSQRVAPAGSVNAPTTFSDTLPFVYLSRISPLTGAVTGGVAGGFLLLVAFPAELLKNTIRENYERAFGWLAPVRRWFTSVGKRAARIRVSEWLGGGLVILVAALALGFAEPDFGFNASSARLFFALVLSLAAVNVIAPAITRVVARRAFATPMTVRPLPAALVLVLASALISRFAHIEPGFLYAGVIGISFGVELDKRSEGILALVTISATATLGLGAWVGYSVLAPVAEAHPSFWSLLWSEALSATTVEALATLAVALLPLRFLEGSRIFAWKRWVWAVAYFIAILILVFVIAPISDNWGPEIAPLFGWGVFFVVFAVVAVGIWVIFRLRPPRGEGGEARSAE